MEKHLKGHDVLELKAQLMDRVVSGPFTRYMSAFLADISRKSHGGYNTVELLDFESGDKLEASPGQAWCLSEYQTLLLAESYLIGAQMNALIRLAATDVPDEMTFEQHILPSNYGFLVFEDPWETIDVRGKQLLTRVITWQPMADKQGKLGVQVTEYSAFSDNDEITQQLRTMSTPKQFEDYQKMFGDLQPQHIMPLQFGMSIAQGIDSSWNLDQIRASAGPVKAMLALWMLMQQRVTETVVPSMTPRSERRWNRKKVKPAVNVINLRNRRIVSQTAAQHESGGGREWSGRWMVKGHWRNQPYGPGRVERHWLYIHPFLKGPDNLPIIDKRPRVYKLSR